MEEAVKQQTKVMQQMLKDNTPKRPTAKTEPESSEKLAIPIADFFDPDSCGEDEADEEPHVNKDISTNFHTWLGLPHSRFTWTEQGERLSVYIQRISGNKTEKQLSDVWGIKKRGVQVMKEPANRLELVQALWTLFVARKKPTV